MKDLAGQTLGQYKILRKLGAGGMATVYKAHEMSLNRVVALKVIGDHLADDQKFLERFQREARAAAALNHPNIVQIYAIGENEGVHWFAMEYVKGRSVEEILKEEGFFTAAKAAPIVRQVAEALAVAHEAGIVHRDIKPANIMIDTVGRVKVADFGIAQVAAAGTRLTREGFLVGTPEYISPEQCRGENLDGRTDIYSLGVTFYQMLTGRTPFEADTPAALVLQITEGRVPSVADLNPTIAPDVRDIVARMMHVDRDERFRTAEDLIAALKNADVSVTRPQPRPGATVSMDDTGATGAATQQDGASDDRTEVMGAAAGAPAAAGADKTEIMGEEPGPTEIVSTGQQATEPDATRVAGATAAGAGSEPAATSGKAATGAGKAQGSGPRPTAAAATSTADAEAERKATGRRNAYIALAGLAALLLVAFAAGAWAFLGGDDAGLAADTGSSEDLVATADGEPGTETGEAEAGAAAAPESGADEDTGETASTPGAAGAGDDTGTTSQDPEAAATDTSVTDRGAGESATGDSSGAGGAPTEQSGGGQPTSTGESAGTTAGSTGGAAAGGGDPASTASNPSSGGADGGAAAAGAPQTEPTAPSPSPDSLVVTVSGDLPYANTMAAWLETRAGDRGFELVDWPSVSDSPLEEVARFHLAVTAEVVNQERLDYFGQSTVQYTASLTLRVVDPATGTTLAGPASEMVKYTSTNAEQNLRTATRRLSDQLLRNLRASGR